VFATLVITMPAMAALGVMLFTEYRSGNMQHCGSRLVGQMEPLD
jgi:hypothetical protein